MPGSSSITPERTRRRRLPSLFVQVLIGIALGIATGVLFPDFGRQLAPLGEGFIKMIKMVVAPLIFLVIVTGIAKVGSLKALGSIGGQGAALVHRRHALRAAARHGRRQRLPARRRYEHRPDDVGHDRARREDTRRPPARHDRVHPEHHPDQRVQCVCRQRPAAGAVLRDPVRRRTGRVGEQRTSGAHRGDRSVAARHLQDRRLCHVPGPARRVRRDGGHGRQLRCQLTHLVRSARACRLRLGAGVHPGDVGAGQAHHRSERLEVRALLQGRIHARARHRLLRGRHAADHHQADQGGLRPCRRRARGAHGLLLQPRRGRPSTCRWRCSSCRRPSAWI